MIGGGAALSVFAGAEFAGDANLTLLIIMTLSLLCGLLSILYVLWREKQLGNAGET